MNTNICYVGPVFVVMIRYENVNFNSIFVISTTAIRARPICRNFFKSVFFPNKNIRSILPLLY